ncbi:MAG: hypothetical protein ACYS5V_17000 [Planctomycetota bacterium]|jgi:hypothetical protein
MPSIKDPHNVQIGSTAVTDVLGIRWSEDRAVIRARADDDLYDTIAEFGGASVVGAVTFRDPVQAAAFAGCGGTLSCAFTGIGGGDDKTLPEAPTEPPAPSAWRSAGGPPIPGATAA